jgi:hypothetical protein
LDKTRLAVIATYIEGIDKHLISELDKISPGLVRIGDPDQATAGVRDALNAEMQGGYTNRFANDQLYSDVSLGELAAVPSPAPALEQFRPVNIPEGESITVAGQPSDIIPKTPIDDLPWGQRQIIKTLRRRFGTPANMDRPWVSVNNAERGFTFRVGGKKGTVTVSQDELMQMEQDGWIDVRLDQNGDINGVKPGPELQAEGRAMSEVEDALTQNMMNVVGDAGAEPVRLAEEALARAQRPVPAAQEKIAELQAELETAIAQGKANVVAARELL